MKDKRQRMAFTWPYGDPQMFAYMLSAVAATANGTVNNNVQLIPPPAIAATFHSQNLNASSQESQHQQQPEVKQQQQHKTTNKLTINTDTENQLNLNIKTPSPNVSLSSSSFSSSCSSSSNLSQTPSKKQNSTPSSTNHQISGLTSPISLYIPHSNATNVYQQRQSAQENSANSLNQFRNNLLVAPQFNMSAQPAVAPLLHPVSFKSPAFGLANIEQQQSFNSLDSSNTSSFSSFFSLS